MLFWTIENKKPNYFKLQVVVCLYKQGVVELPGSCDACLDIHKTLSVFVQFLVII